MPEIPLAGPGFFLLFRVVSMKVDAYLHHAGNGISGQQAV
jgi:hypothetical protein